MSTTLSRLADLAPAERRRLLDGAFDVEALPAAPLRMSDALWAGASAVLQAPRHAVEHQTLVVTRDLLLGTEALFNPRRARRVAAPAAPPARVAAPGCRWCHPALKGDGQPDLAEDGFGTLRSADGRARASANWARSAPVSGVVFGDAGMHDLLSLDGEAFASLFDAAGRYVAAAQAALPQTDFFEVFVNGGPRSAASVEHAHVQVVGRPHRHFAYPERVAAVPGYWQRAQRVHSAVGLAVDFDQGCAWAELVPAKDCGITALSVDLVEGARMMHAILRSMIERGTNAYSLCAILAPRWTAGRAPPARFRDWPAVVWRLLDRGDARAAHGDIGCLELWGSSVVATDPYIAAAGLRQAASACARRAAAGTAG